MRVLCVRLSYLVTIRTNIDLPIRRALSFPLFRVCCCRPAQCRPICSKRHKSGFVLKQNHLKLLPLSETATFIKWPLGIDYKGKKHTTFETQTISNRFLNIVELTTLRELRKGRMCNFQTRNDVNAVLCI